MVAQEFTLQAPDLVRKLILVGTGPRGGEGMASLTQVAQRIFGAAYDPPSRAVDRAGDLRVRRRYRRARADI